MAMLYFISFPGSSQDNKLTTRLVSGRFSISYVLITHSHYLKGVNKIICAVCVGAGAVILVSIFINP